MSYLHDRSHKKTISSRYQVGVPSKHAQNEDEKYLNRNNSTKRNINGRIRVICMQDSAPPGIQAQLISNKNGVFTEKRHNNMWNLDWHDSSIITNRGKKSKIRPKQCVFDSLA